MRSKPIPPWKEAPFIRYIVPFIAGILLQKEYPVPPASLWIAAGICWGFLLAFGFFRPSARYGGYHWAGTSAFLLLVFLGALITHFHNIQSSSQWIGHHPEEASALLVTLEEPPEEKQRSYKAIARVSLLVTKDTVKPAIGRLILYFQKDKRTAALTYGSRLLIMPRLQLIADFKNTTGFSYRKYCALQNIYHQQYIRSNACIILPGNLSSFSSFPVQQLFALRQSTISMLRKYIKGSREAGLAEALLIGYKNDLDKKLVQSYTNTGVVHIIAISGLHVGLIYSILSWLLAPLTAYRCTKWLPPLLLLAALWVFSALAGGSASVVRSAVMFSFIIAGRSLGRGSPVYNSLSASAFVLLCYDPYWLWDVGFQLSYLAIAGIVLFRKPVYDLFYLQNKLMDMLWKMAAITISAQLLTTPICLYHFHQFPNTFLITNSIAVPLSSLILSGELLLCIAARIPPAAVLLGNILEWLIRLLNDFIAHSEKIPFAVTHGIGISAGQVIILYGIIGVAGFLWKRKRESSLSY